MLFFGFLARLRAPFLLLRLGPSAASSPLVTSSVMVEFEVAGCSVNASPAACGSANVDAEMDASGTARPWPSTARAATVAAAVVMPGILISVELWGMVLLGGCALSGLDLVNWAGSEEAMKQTRQVWYRERGDLG